MRPRIRTSVIASTLAVAAIGAAVGLIGAAQAANAGPSYTLAQVRQHATAKNCWTAVNGGVYNVTKWIPRHPGGAPVIKAMCGTNATAAFKSKHGLKGSEAKLLTKYRIGTLKVTAKSKPKPSSSPATVSNALSVLGVSTHRTASSCWTIVNGKVYDVTAWIGKHPGGKAVIQAMCGIDATAAFTGMHGKSAKATAELARFLLGPVVGPSSPVDTATVTETATVGTVLTLAEVAKHATAGDCWSIVNGTVYVLTNWVSVHAGGRDVIVAMCGHDASDAFTAKHARSATANARLGSFAIGALGSTVGAVVAPPAPPAPAGGGGAVTPPTPSGPGMNGETLTVAIVAQHATAASCWSIVNGNVYDLTNWVNAHPGGPDFIVPMCGNDATGAFTTKHSGSPTAQAKLAAFKIGVLGSPAVVGNPPPAPVPANTMYTAAEVRAHASGASCWTVINTTVYDLTDWINRHPGGRSAILAACGRNATAAFTTVRDHRAAQYAMLEGFAIGAVTSADAASLATAVRVGD